MKNKIDKYDCNKKVPSYKSITEVRKGTPYESKLGGIPYIPKGDKWVTCSKCHTEKVLLVQLNIKELPDVSTALKEWDFIQIFACMKPSQKLLEDEVWYDEFKRKYRWEREYSGYNEDVTEFIYKRKEANRCYNIVERNPYSDYLFDEKVDGENMHPRDPFNLYFDIKLVKKDKPAEFFSSPPWIEAFNLYLNENNKIVSLLSYNDKRSYIWVEQHLFREKIITSWEKLDDMKCRYHSKDLNMCSGNADDSDLLGFLNSYWVGNDVGFESLSYYIGEKNLKEFISCPLCKKPLTLLFQFSFSEENELIVKSERDDCNRHHVYALFYCEDEPEVMSCQWVGYED